MGYTHYWYRPAELLHMKRFHETAVACRKVCDWLAKERGVLLCLDPEAPDIDHPDNGPVFDMRTVRFNGAVEPYEDFLIDQVYDPEPDVRPGERMKFGFCKTNRNEYSSAVAACLIVFRRHFGQHFAVSSDGDDSSPDWVLAREACQAALGYGGDFKLPTWVDAVVMLADGIKVSAYYTNEWSGGLFHFKKAIDVQARHYRGRDRYYYQVFRYGNSGDILGKWLGKNRARWHLTKLTFLELLKLSECPGLGEDPTARAIIDGAELGDWCPFLILADRVEEFDAKLAGQIRAWVPRSRKAVAA
jgi:hypothetical protein